MFQSRRFASLFTVLCLLVVSLVPLGTATADALQSTTLPDIRQSILDRAEDNYTDIDYGKDTVAENGLHFKVTDYYFFSDKEDGTMNVLVYIDVGRNDLTASSYGLAQYDFTLVSFPEGDTSAESMQAFFPDAVYDVTGERSQELVWPVHLYGEDDLSLCLSYEAPKALLQFGFEETNVLTNDDGTSTVMGPLYSFTFHHLAIDFNLTNSLGVDVVGLYAAPSDSSDWGGELLAGYSATEIAAGGFLDIWMDKSDFADSDATSWKIRMDLSDGTTNTFDQLPLRDILDITVREEDGKRYIDLGY